MKKDEATVSEEEKAVRAEVKPMIDEARRQYDEDDSLNKRNFILYLQRTYVPEEKR